MALVGCATSSQSDITQDITQPTCITIQSQASVDDTYISANALTKNKGGQPILRVSAKDESLLRFDLGAVPTSATISRATLHLYANGDAGDGTIEVHRALVPWSESSATFSNFAQKFATEASAAFKVESKTAGKSVELTSMVTSWLSGAHPNYGMALIEGPDHHGHCDRDEDEDRDPTVFVSSESASVSKRPALEVCYVAVANHCAPNPCGNGGTCVNDSNGFTCQCPPGFTGSRCQTNIDDCALSPCQNGGACQDGIGTYTCACPAGYTGANCETNIDDCSPDPCQNGAVCTDGVASFTCACAPGYDGATCDHQIDNCDSMPCHNGGTCNNEVGGYTCACATGFSGATCDTNVDDCVGNVCVNGTCIDGINRYTCSCAPDWGGGRFDVYLISCGQNPCLNGATCANGFGNYTCNCAPGYEGANCEIDINDCATNPCENKGACVDAVNSFTCMCTSGFTGPTCGTNIDDCASAPCHNGGACTDGVDQFTCTCPIGFSGATCDGEIVKVTGTLRDFGSTLPAGIGRDEQIILGTDGYPFEFGLLHAVGAQWSDATAIASAPYTLALTAMPDPTIFSFDSDAFSPLGNTDAFSLELHTAITYTPGLVLNVSATEPLLVFIGGELEPRTVATHATIDFDAIASTAHLTPGDTFAVDIFFAHSTGAPTPLHLQLARPTCSPRTQTALVPVPLATVRTSGNAKTGTVQAEDLESSTSAPTPALQLVPSASTSTSGAVWAPPAMRVGVPFRTDFEFLTPRGAEGFAFVMATPSQATLGATAGGLGYAGLASIAIEVDAHSDAALADPSIAQVSIHSRGAAPNSASEGFGVGAVQGTSGNYLVDIGDWNHMTIDYEPVPGQGFGWLRVYLDNGSPQVGVGPDPNIPVATAQISDITLTGALGSDTFVMGFTSSTDVAANVQGETDITGWRISNVDCRAPTCGSLSSTLTTATTLPATVQLPGSGSLVLQTRDSVGLEYRTGGAAACFAAAIVDANGAVPATIADNRDGTYTVSYAPTEPGMWNAIVRLAGTDVGGSPYSFSAE